MPLGDALLNRFSSAKRRAITLTTTYASVLPADPLRVGFWVPRAANNQLWAPFQVPEDADVGYFFGSGANTQYWITFANHGDLCFAEWFARELTTGETIFVIEWVIPAKMRHLITGQVM